MEIHIKCVTFIYDLSNVICIHARMHALHVYIIYIHTQEIIKCETLFSKRLCVSTTSLVILLLCIYIKFYRTFYGTVVKPKSTRTSMK